MGFDYALVHLKYTIPPAIALTVLYRPLFIKLDLYKLGFLITIAVLATIPWDSYLIRRGIWSYPRDAVVGWTLFAIPAEELFFFVIQTYLTTFVFLFLSKPLLRQVYLSVRHNGSNEKVVYSAQTTFIVTTIGQVILSGVLLWGIFMVIEGQEATYMGLIIIWAFPFLLLLWSLASELLLNLPAITTIGSIMAPTVYLWFIDQMALHRGTWVIEKGTKLDIQLWGSLDIEEATFFLLTNCLIVFGLVAFEQAVAVLEALPETFHSVSTFPSPLALIQALLIRRSETDDRRIVGMCDSLATLRAKSRSFFLASSFFSGRLRIDLILLYAFARVADDLVDNAASPEEAQMNYLRLRGFLDVCYESAPGEENDRRVEQYIEANFPVAVQAQLRLLPFRYLSSGPLYELLEGFLTDLQFGLAPSTQQKLSGDGKGRAWPIASEVDLELYASRVAGTIAELCLELAYHHHPRPLSPTTRRHLVQTGGEMGIALQCINIARDIAVDARIGRVYIPTSWLKDVGMIPEDLLRDPEGAGAGIVRRRMLSKALGIYHSARPAIEKLPDNVRGPMRVAVESYVEIGRVMQEGNFRRKQGRATVPKLRRLRVALQNIS